MPSKPCGTSIGRSAGWYGRSKVKVTSRWVFFASMTALAASLSKPPYCPTMNSVTPNSTSVKTVLFFTSFFILQPWLFPFGLTLSTKKKIFPSAWSLDFILLAVNSNGIHISTCFFLKVLSETILLGVSLHIFLLSISENLG